MVGRIREHESKPRERKVGRSELDGKGSLMFPKLGRKATMVSSCCMSIALYNIYYTNTVTQLLLVRRPVRTTGNNATQNVPSRIHADAEDERSISLVLVHLHMCVAATHMNFLRWWLELTFQTRGRKTAQMLSRGNPRKPNLSS